MKLKASDGIEIEKVKVKMAKERKETRSVKNNNKF